MAVRHQSHIRHMPVWVIIVVDGKLLARKSLNANQGEGTALRQNPLVPKVKSLNRIREQIEMDLEENAATTCAAQSAAHAEAEQAAANFLRGTWYDPTIVYNSQGIHLSPDEGIYVGHSKSGTKTWYVELPWTEKCLHKREGMETNRLVET